MEPGTDALVDHQTDRGPHPYSGIEHMDSDGVFRVESIQRGSGAQTRDGVSPHEHIESRQAAQQVRLLCRVDPVPDANEAAVFHLDVELLAGHDREQLRGGGEPAGLLENC